MPLEANRSSNPIQIQIQTALENWLNPDLNPNPDLDLPTIAVDMFSQDFSASKGMDIFYERVPPWQMSHLFVNKI